MPEFCINSLYDPVLNVIDGKPYEFASIIELEQQGIYSMPKKITLFLL